MPRKRRLLTREEMLRPARAGRQTWGEYKKTPEYFIHWMQALMAITHPAALIEDFPSRPTIMGALYRAANAVVKHAKAGDWQAATVAAFTAGERFAESHLARDAKAARASRADLEKRNQERLAEVKKNDATFLKVYREERQGKVSHTEAAKRAGAAIGKKERQIWVYTKRLNLVGKKPKK